MNQVIKELYEIAAQAGALMEHANHSRQAMQENMKKQMEQIQAESEAELEARLTILKSRLEEQAQEEVQQLEQKNRQQMAQLNEDYEAHLFQYAQQIVKKITEV